MSPPPPPPLAQQPRHNDHASPTAWPFDVLCGLRSWTACSTGAAVVALQKGPLWRWPPCVPLSLVCASKLGLLPQGGGGQLCGLCRARSFH